MYGLKYEHPQAQQNFTRSYKKTECIAIRNRTQTSLFTPGKGLMARLVINSKGGWVGHNKLDKADLSSC